MKGSDGGLILPCICLEGLRRTTKNPTQNKIIQVQTRTENLPDKIQERYLHTNLLIK
jgi:hypothetical protein